MAKLLLIDNRLVELTDEAAEFFVREAIAFPNANPTDDHHLDLSGVPPWDARPIRRLLLFLGGYDVSEL